MIHIGKRENGMEEFLSFWNFEMVLGAILLNAGIVLQFVYVFTEKEGLRKIRTLLIGTGAVCLVLGLLLSAWQRKSSEKSLECSSCHEEIDEEDSYCSNCGIKIELETE